MRVHTGHFSRQRRTAYLFLSPGALALLVFTVAPFIGGIALSLWDLDLFATRPPRFVGLDNYAELLSNRANPLFWRAFFQSIYWTIGVVVGQLVLGYGTALLLNERFVGRAFYRSLLLIPWAVPSVVAVLVWQWMYDGNFGMVNYYLQQAGLIDRYQPWLAQEETIMPAAILVAVWKGLPFVAIVHLAGLQAIPADLYEAAKVDGAGRVHRFRYLTVPLMRSVTTITVVLTTIWWYNSFNIQYIMSPYGVQAAIMNLPLMAWLESFKYLHLGRGAAISTVILLFLTALMVYHVRRESERRV